MDHQKSATVATATSWSAWGTWWLGHVVQINQVLQFFVLIVGLATGLYALRWQMRHK